jgi:hypothetical protein
MPLRVPCACGRLIVISESVQGRLIRCPRCDRQMRVPGTPPEIPSPPPPPETESESPPPSTAKVSQWYYAQVHHRRMVSYFCAGLIGLAMIGVLPIVFSLLESRAQAATFEVQRWAYVLLLVGVLQLAYAIYLVQIPDWSSVWVISIATLLLATAYATLMGIRLLAGDGNPVILFFDLDDNPFSSGQEAGWCFIMLLLTSALSFLAGRFGTRWYLEQKTIRYDTIEN